MLLSASTIALLTILLGACNVDNFESPTKKPAPLIKSVVFWQLGESKPPCLGVVISPTQIATSKACSKDVVFEGASIEVKQHPTEDIALIILDRPSGYVALSENAPIAQYVPETGESVWVVLSSPLGILVETSFDGMYNNEGIGFNDNGEVLSVYGVDVSLLFDLFP